nr:uncharacterized protein LOC106847054 isoform X3 [Equus asinus]
MMMMSRTQPLGEGRPGLCVAKGGLRVVGGGDAAGKGGSGARARAGHPGGAGCFLSRPRARGGGGGWRKAGPAPPPGIDDSAAGHGHLGQGQRRGRRSADATDGFGGACRRRAPVFRAVSEAKRDRPELRCSRSPCRPPFRILQRRRGPPRRRLFTSDPEASRVSCTLDHSWNRFITCVFWLGYHCSVPPVENGRQIISLMIAVVRELPMSIKRKKKASGTGKEKKYKKGWEEKRW